MHSRGITIVLAVSLFFLVYPLNAQEALRVHLPSRAALAALEKARHCDVLKQVVQKTRQTIQRQTKVRRHYLEQVKKARLELLSCGKKRAGFVDSLQDETVLARICPSAYESWLSPSYAVYMIDEDLSEANSSLVQSQDHVSRYCGLANNRKIF